MRNGMDARIKSGHDGVEELCRWNREPYRRVLSANLTGQLDRFLNRERNRPNRIARIGGLGSGRSTSGSPIGPFKRTLKMKKLMTILVAALALGLVAFTPDLASAGHGHGGGHGWHGHRGWYGYRGWRGYGWGGWWGPGINIYVAGYGRRCWSPAYGYYPCRYRYGWGY
jgi:hypothetical protein